MTEARRPHWRHRSAEVALVVGAMLVCLLGVLSPGALAGTSGSPHEAGRALAHAARTIRASDEAKLVNNRQRSAGSRLFEEGTAHGTLPGSVRAECDLGATFSANVTIYTSAGTIQGHGTATPHASGIYESFSGTMTLTRGTGRYAHAHGHAGLYGVFNRRTYALTVQLIGSLSLAG